MTFCYINKSEPCSVTTRKSIASSCSKWEQIQRPTSRQYERVKLYRKEGEEKLQVLKGGEIRIRIKCMEKKHFQ